MALIAMDCYNFLTGFLLIIGGVLMIAGRVTRKDFQMNYGTGQYLSAGIILVLLGCAMVINALDSRTVIGLMLIWETFSE